MGKIYETATEPLEYKDVAKEILELYNDLLELYMDIFEKYQKLAIALDEVDSLEQSDLDKYVVAQCKMNYFMKTMPSLFDEEREIFKNNSDLLPFLYQHIKKVYKLDKVIDINSFSIFDTLIYSKYDSIKENYLIARMIRAIKFYTIFNANYTILVELNQLDYTEEDILNDIGLDYVDIEAVNTINQLSALLSEHDEIHIVNTYKCNLMFCNPCLEYKYFSLAFEDFFIPPVNEEINPGVLDQVINLIKSKTINTLLSIEHNPIINHDNRRRLIAEPISDKPKDLDEYNYNKNELYLLYAYILQSYSYYSLKSIEDFDHLFTVMCNDNGKDYEDIRLSKRVVDYFFRKNAFDNPLFSQRVRKDD